jgi:uncharacterized protein
MDLPAPTEPQQRIGSIDTIRGAALLGILAINIVGFAQPRQSIAYPAIAGGFEGINWVLWCLADLFMEGKMRAIFSMLFGASVIIFTSAKQARVGEEAADLYYRRTIWLIVFGVLHAYLIWPGDILYAYGVTGLLLYPVRKSAPRALIIAGLVFLSVISTKELIHGLELRSLRNAAGAGNASSASARPPDERWANALRESKPDPADILAMVRARRSDWWTSFQWRSATAKENQSTEFYQTEFWDVCGMMLIGMGLFKLGVFSALRTSREYVALASCGYGIGLSLGVLSIWFRLGANFDPATTTLVHSLHQVVRLSVALGHIAVLALMCRAGVLRLLTSRLARVGQMALTNYIVHSVVCSFVFYGVGLGLYGTMERREYYLVMLSIWVFQLVVSPIWLAQFRFGPLEWLWRTLTYWSLQPMRLPRRASAAPSGHS